MKIEKLACCLAHPVTALRAIKEKIDEIIDGHNGLTGEVNNLKLTGGGGSGSGSVVWVTFSELSSSTVEGGITQGIIADFAFTFAELVELYEAGALLIVNYNQGNQSLFFPVSQYTVGEQFIFTLNLSAMGEGCYMIMCMADGTNLFVQTE